MNNLQAERKGEVRGLISGLALILLTCGCAAAAQSNRVSRNISGVIRDPSGSPIAGATVQLTCPNLNLNQVTQGEGKFEFRAITCAAGELMVRAAGFSPLERRWHARSLLPMVITLLPERVAEKITVTATLAREPAGESAADVTLLGSRHLSTTATLSLDGVLRQVPGFVLFRRTNSLISNPTSQGVSLRGIGASGASRALVLEDGIPLNDPFGGWVYWDRIPRESLEAVEVARGGFSSLYGDEALGGVINIFPRRPSEPSFDVESSLGTEGTPYVSSIASLRSGKWIGTADGEASRTGGYVLVDRQERGSVDTPATSAHSVGDLDLSRIISDQSRVFARASIFRETRHNGTPLQRNRTHLRQVAAGGSVQSGKGGSLIVRAYAGDELFDQTFSAVAADRNSETLTDVQRVPSQFGGASVHWLKPAGFRHTFVAGFEAQTIRGASDELLYRAGVENSSSDAGGRQRWLGFFGEDIIRFTAKGTVTLGARLDDWRNHRGLLTTQPLAIPGPARVTQFQNRTEHSFNPRLGAAYRLKRNLVLRASAYRAFRAPTLNELYRTFRVGNVLTEANASLLAERLTGAETGAAYQTFGDRLTVRGTYFWSELSRPVSNVTLSVQPNLITRQRQNLGRIGSQGVELDVEARLSPRWSFSSGYQFVNAKVQSFSANPGLVGLLLPHVPRNELSLQAVYGDSRRYTLGLQARAVGSEFDDDRNRLVLGRYFALDVFLSRRLARGFEVFAAGENLSNSRFDVARTPVRTVGPPISVRGGIRFTAR